MENLFYLFYNLDWSANDPFIALAKGNDFTKLGLVHDSASLPLLNVQGLARL